MRLAFEINSARRHTWYTAFQRCLRNSLRYFYRAIFLRYFYLGGETRGLLYSLHKVTFYQTGSQLVCILIDTFCMNAYYFLLFLLTNVFITIRIFYLSSFF